MIVDNNIAQGTFINVGRYLSIPEDHDVIKLADLPLPSIVIKSKGKADFDIFQYAVKLDNNINIPANYKFILQIILKKRFGNYEMISTDLIHKTSLIIAIKYNNGLYKKYDLLADLTDTYVTVAVKGSSIEITGTVNIGTSELLRVEEIKYQISSSGFRINKLNYFAPNNHGISQPYSGNAFILVHK